jgi:PAS domain S-box-containing protein
MLRFSERFMDSVPSQDAGLHQIPLAGRGGLGDLVRDPGRLLTDPGDSLLRLIIDLVPHFVFAKNADGVFLFVNRAAAGYHGLTPEELVGRSELELNKNTEEVQRYLRDDRDVIASGAQKLIAQEPCTDPDGRVRYLQTIKVPFQVPGTGEDAVLGICIDITDQVCARNTLQEVDRRKDEFLAMLGHELRNPLSAIVNAVGLCRGGADPATNEWAHEVIARQSAQLGRLVDDLLDVARISRGTITLRKAPVDVAMVIARAAESVRQLFEQKSHRLDVSLAPGARPAVHGDAARLEQVFVNLLHNAAKYTEEGGLILISERYTGSDAIVTVRDNGVGISPEILPRVFELFAQADCSLDRVEGGLGVGLTIVRQIVELHGGAVTAESDGVGTGSRFMVRLPALGAPSADAPPAKAAQEPPTAKRRIVLVDDNEDTVRSLAGLLTRRGHEVQVAYDGPGGLAAAREFGPDVLLLDIGLPGFDGFELARRLRQDRFADALMIAISGYAQESDREQSRSAGFDYHLAKPVDLAELTRLLATTAHPARDG